jgi:hypothetical protein
MIFLFKFKNRFIIDPNKLDIDVGKVMYIISLFKETIK